MKGGVPWELFIIPYPHVHEKTVFYMHHKGFQTVTYRKNEMKLMEYRLYMFNVSRVGFFSVYCGSQISSLSN